MIAIVGAGAIGRYWAYQLGANDCIFVDTRDNAPRNTYIQFKTLHARTADASSPTPSTNSIKFPKLNLQALDSRWNELTGIFLCTKSYDALDAALALNRSSPTDLPLLLFQNGLGSQYQIKQAITTRSVYAATMTSGANIDSNNNLVLAGEGITKAGLLKQTSEPLQRSLHLALHDLNISIVDNIEDALWRKLIINCGINAFTAIENCQNGLISTTETFRHCWPALVDELYQLALTKQLCLSKVDVENMILSVAQSTRLNVSSMLHDVRQNKQTEIDDINGFAANTLRAKGLSANTNQLLVERVHALRN